jgi:hypothetical protein
MMSEFCVKCSGLESEMELLRKKHYEEMQCMKEKIKKLKDEVESLSFDLAFYEGKITNLSCNNK